MPKNSKYICEMCGVYNRKEVGLATGFDGVTEARVCNACDIDGSNYNGWGGYDDEDYIGKYIGDCYGCVDGECKECYRCNPVLYWTQRRLVPRFDKVKHLLCLASDNEPTTPACPPEPDCPPDDDCDSEEEVIICPHCNRNEEECEKNAEGVKNPITEWCGWGLSCDDCYYKNHPDCPPGDDSDSECSGDEEDDDEEDDDEEDDDDIETEMQERFIIPNWYEPYHFTQSKNWDEHTLKRFKEFMADKLCSYDPFKNIIEEYMDEFMTASASSSK